MTKDVVIQLFLARNTNHQISKPSAPDMLHIDNIFLAEIGVIFSKIRHSKDSVSIQLRYAFWPFNVCNVCELSTTMTTVASPDAYSFWLELLILSNTLIGI